MLSITDSVMGVWSYACDDFNRLTTGNMTAGFDAGLSLGWTYDRGPRRDGAPEERSVFRGVWGQVFVPGVEDRYGNRRRLEFNFDLAPGADPRSIRL